MPFEINILCNTSYNTILAVCLSILFEFTEIVDAPGLDIFGQELIKKKPLECVCPNCERNMAAARFAPHLEKCMGNASLLIVSLPCNLQLRNESGLA